MKKHIWKGHRNLAHLEEGKDISSKDILLNYYSLKKELDVLSNDIKKTIDNNDYVQLMVLVNQRNHIHIAINAIESLYDDKKLHSSSFNKFIIWIGKHKISLHCSIQIALSIYTNHLIKPIMKTIRSIGKE